MPKVPIIVIRYDNSISFFRQSDDKSARKGQEGDETDIYISQEILSSSSFCSTSLNSGDLQIKSAFAFSVLGETQC